MDICKKFLRQEICAMEIMDIIFECGDKMKIIIMVVLQLLQDSDYVNYFFENRKPRDWQQRNRLFYDRLIYSALKKSSKLLQLYE